MYAEGESRNLSQCAVHEVGIDLGIPTGLPFLLHIA